MTRRYWVHETSWEKEKNPEGKGEEISYETLNLELKVLDFGSACPVSWMYHLISLGLSLLSYQVCVHMGGGMKAWLASQGPFCSYGLLAHVCDPGGPSNVNFSRQLEMGL